MLHREELNVNVESIVAEIDAQIARLQTAKSLLTFGTAAAEPRKRGRPTKSKTEAPVPKKAAKRRTMSTEAKERIRQAQIKRWAAAKKTAKPNLNVAAAPLPKVKKASKSATP